MSRAALFFVILALIIWGPYWLYFPAILAALVYIPLYYEALFFGFLIDLIYGPQGSWQLEHIFLLLGAWGILVSFPLRQSLRLHA